MAALIQSLASPGAVLVSRFTHRLIEGFRIARPASPAGRLLPSVSVYRIEEDRGVHSRSRPPES